MSTFTLAGLRNVADELRATYYPKNETEKKVYEALSSLQNWGASTTLLNDIASDTFDYERYPIVMSSVWKIMSSEGRTWKQLFKALSLLEFLVKSGAERCIEDMRDHMRSIRSLQEYNFYDGNVDKGGGVREKAGQLISLLGNNESIREEREKAKRLRDKFVGISNNGYGGSGARGGSDHYSGGGGGSDRYSGGGGGSDRYSGGGGGQSSGGHSSDNYSSGSSGRYNSRYGNDSYSSSNDRPSSESSGYGNGGIDSYASGGIGSSKKAAPSRYGGGSYDTDNKSRYSDEATDVLDTHGSPSRGGRSHAPTDSYAAQSTDYGADDGSKKSSKIKISIKDNKSRVHQTAPQPQEEVDLFADPTRAAAAPTAAAAAPFFDAFGDGPAPAASAQPAQPDTFFDAFVSPTPAPAAAASFDPFAVQAHSSVPLQGGSHGAQFNMQGQQYPPQSNPQYQMPSYAPQPAYAVSGASYAAPAPAIPQQHYAQQAPRSEPAIEAQDFGDFESAKPVAPVAKNKKTNDWSNLVNLDNMSKAEPANGNGQAKKNDGFQDSFQGLDGFKRPQQHSQRSGAPLSSMGHSSSMGNAMMQSGGMSMGGAPPMGGMSGGGMPVTGYPMHGNPGGFYPMQGQMGGGYPSGGGYPNPNMGSMGPGGGIQAQQMGYNPNGHMGYPGSAPPGQPYRY